MSEDDTELDLSGLEKLEKAIQNAPIVKVGILGDGSKRQNGGLTNASVGLVHEVGDGQMPQRSFLRVPISERLDKEIESAGIVNRVTLRQIIKTGSLVDFMRKVGVIAEGIVADAFATGGFGKWKKSDMRYKKVHMTLVETQQLRNSITSEVEEKPE